MGRAEQKLGEWSPTVSTVGELGTEEIGEKLTVRVRRKAGDVIAGEIGDEAEPTIDVESDGTGATVLIKIFLVEGRFDVETHIRVAAKEFHSGCVLALRG